MKAVAPELAESFKIHNIFSFSENLILLTYVLKVRVLRLSRGTATVSNYNKLIVIQKSLRISKTHWGQSSKLHQTLF